MGIITDKIKNDVRFQEAFKSCMNCGMCTAVCPAAEFYLYDPRNICNIVQRGNDEELEKLLRSDTIWYCGQCMSCKTRCPRGNAPGVVITILRTISQEMGYFTDSEKGRQQYAIEQIVGGNILNIGYCVHPDTVDPDLHPEQGPVWSWFVKNIDALSEKMGANWKKDGAGALRTIRKENLDEMKKIFDVTGGTELRKRIEQYSEEKAKELNINTEREEDQKYSDYLMNTMTQNNNQHCK